MAVPSALIRHLSVVEAEAVEVEASVEAEEAMAAVEVAITLVVEEVIPGVVEDIVRLLPQF